MDIASPIYDMDTKAVLGTIKEFDILISPLYEKLFQVGIPLKEIRTASLMNYSASVEEIKEIDPELFEELESKFELTSNENILKENKIQRISKQVQDYKIWGRTKETTNRIMSVCQGKVDDMITYEDLTMRVLLNLYKKDEDYFKKCKKEMIELILKARYSDLSISDWELTSLITLSEFPQEIVFNVCGDIWFTTDILINSTIPQGVGLKSVSVTHLPQYNPTKELKDIVKNVDIELLLSHSPMLNFLICKYGGVDGVLRELNKANSKVKMITWKDLMSAFSSGNFKTINSK